MHGMHVTTPLLTQHRCLLLFGMSQYKNTLYGLYSIPYTECESPCTGRGYFFVHRVMNKPPDRGHESCMAVLILGLGPLSGLSTLYSAFAEGRERSDAVPSNQLEFCGKAVDIILVEFYNRPSMDRNVLHVSIVSKTEVLWCAQPVDKVSYPPIRWRLAFQSNSRTGFSLCRTPLHV